MLFRCYKPSRRLSDFIENFWLYDGYESPHFQERILPSGTFELVFNLRDDELRIYRTARPDRCERFSGAIVSGPYNGFFVTDRKEESCVMGAHFRPGGAFPFLGLAAEELADTHVDLEMIWGRQSREIRERLYLLKSAKLRFQFLERMLLARLFRPLEHHPAVSLALDGFRRDNSRGVVRRLAQEAGLSDRRFIDVFRLEAGLNPKLFHRIERFQRILRLTRDALALDWSRVAVENGYFDQSHLIRDFLTFSGLSPADYLRRISDLRKQGSHIKFNHLPVA